MDEQESLKIEFEFCKHIATLSTGSILVLVAFADKIFDGDFSKWAIYSVFFFLMAILGSLGVQMDIIDEQKKSPVTKFKSRARRLTIFGFMAGLGMLVKFIFSSGAIST